MAELNWQKIVGHDAKIARLRALIKEDKMPHALLIAGPDGVGKFLVAQMTAAALFCNNQDTKPCGSCPACRAMMLDNHPDMLVVEPDGQAIKIEQIRTLQAKISLAPYLGRYRIAILRQAEKLTVPAANGLLKMIEEPAADVVFMLLASNWQAMLPTILSRCRRLDLQPLPIAAMLPILAARGVASERAATIARLSGGSLGKALTLIDHDDLAIRDKAVAVLQQTISGQSMTQLWQQSAVIGELEREKLQTLLSYCKLLWRDLLIMHDDVARDLLYNADLQPLLEPLLSSWPKRRILFAIHEATYLQKALQANVNQRLAVERLFIKLRDL